MRKTVMCGFDHVQIKTLLSKGIIYCFPESKKIDPSSFENVKKGEHYICCRECGSRVFQIVTRHLRGCSGMSLSEYKEKHPQAPIMCSFTSKNKAKTPQQKKAQSEKLKRRFQTPEGEITRKQISEASRRLHHEQGYREKAAAHLRAYGKDPEVRKQRREKTKARWDSGELRETVEGWHQDNRELSLRMAKKARRHIGRKRTKLHLNFKQALHKAGLGRYFETEFEVGFYAVDEADPELQLAVEIDGCYWHSCPVCGYEGPPENRGLDQRKNTYLTKRGWTVLRFWGHEVRTNLDQCVGQVKTMIQTLEGRPHVGPANP